MATKSKTRSGRKVTAPPSFMREFKAFYPEGESWVKTLQTKKRKYRPAAKSADPKPKKAKAEKKTEKPAKKKPTTKKTTKKATEKKATKKTKKASEKKSKKETSKKGTKKAPKAAKNTKKTKKSKKEAKAPSIKRTNSLTLLRGAEYTLEAKAGHIEMGLGWNSPFDIDGGVLVFDNKNQHVDTVDFRNLKSTQFDISHSGDILDGAHHAKTDGDDEKVTVNLHKLPDHITTLMFVAAIYTDGKTWKDVTDGRIRLVDLGTRAEKCRYELTPRAFGETRAVVLCKVYKSSKDGTWKMMSIGEPANDMTLKEPRMMLPHLNPFVWESYVPEGSTVAVLS